MDNKTINTLLGIGFALSLLLLFWPFAQWNGVMSVVLRAAAAVCAQWLLCRVGKYGAIKALPLVVTGALALWGSWLYLTSPHWVNAEFADLMADYVSPFMACAVVCAAAAIVGRRNSVKN